MARDDVGNLMSEYGGQAGFSLSDGGKPSEHSDPAARGYEGVDVSKVDENYFPSIPVLQSSGVDETMDDSRDQLVRLTRGRRIGWIHTGILRLHKCDEAIKLRVRKPRHVRV